MRIAVVLIAGTLSGASIAAAGATASAATIPSWCHPGSSVAGSGNPVTSIIQQNGGAAPSGLFGLLAGDSLATLSSGHVKFCLKIKSTVCDQIHNSSVVIEPSASEVIHYGSGTTSCSTATTQKKGSPPIVLGAGTGKKKIVKLTLSDPVWSVTVSERGVVVGVTTGFVQVAAAAGSPTPVVVGPGTQTVAGPNGIPTPTTQFLAPPEVQASLKSLQSFAPTYPFARPVPGSSPTLQRVTTANVVRIGYDRTAATSQVLAFLKSFASFLGTSWNVKPQLTAVTASSAPKLLASGKVDFVAETSETGTLFLSPTAGAPWRLVTNQDSGADAAAAAFVSDVLNSGKYLTLFQGSFKTVPSYTSFGSVFFK